MAALPPVNAFIVISAGRRTAPNVCSPGGDAALGAGVEISRPQEGKVAVPLPLGPYGKVQGLGGAAGIKGGVAWAGLKAGVEAIGHGDSDAVLDLPEGGYHMRKSGELERGGKMNGLVEQLFRVMEGGPAGRQVRELGVFQPDGGEAGDGQRSGRVVVQQQVATRWVGRIVGAVAGEVRDRAARQLLKHRGERRRPGLGDHRVASG